MEKHFPTCPNFDLPWKNIFQPAQDSECLGKSFSDPSKFRFASENLFPTYSGFGLPWKIIFHDDPGKSLYNKKRHFGDK